LTRRVGKGLLAAAFLLGLLAVIRIVEVRVPIASYETEYLKNEPPAYHLTPVKRLVWQVSERNGSPLSIIYQRRVVAVFRILALVTLLGLFMSHLDRKTGIWAIVFFLALPPTFVYFIRVDPWMDAICFAIISLYFLTAGRHPLLQCLAAGIFSSFAMDSKLTVCLSLIPAGLMLLRSRSGKERWVFLAGILAGFAFAQPAWVLHPSQALAHIDYWRSVNATLPAWSVTYPVAALVSVIPLSVWCLAGIGLLDLRQQMAIRGAVVLAAVPVIFFMFYRTVHPDGVRHFYLVFPFLAAVAAAGLNRLKPIPMSVCVVLWIGETAWRHFPV